MTEHQIERAYWARADHALTDYSILEQLIDRMLSHLNPRSGWLVGAVHPTQPSELPPPLDKNVAANTIALAVRTGTRMCGGVPTPFGPRRPLAVVDQFGDILPNPRPGLRRWVIQDRGGNAADHQDVFLHLELHDDGSLTFATSSGDSSQDPDAEPSIWTDETKIVGFAVDLIAVAYAHATARQVAGRMAARVTLKKFDDRPFALAAHERIGHFTFHHPSRPPWTRELDEFEPIDFGLPPLDPSADNPELQLPPVVERLSSDIATQFGFMPFAVGTS